MADVFSLPIGQVFPMVQNTIYALPGKKCTLYTDATTPTIQQSLTSAFTANTALTLGANFDADVNAGFIRLTSAGPVNIILKAIGG